MNVAGLLLLLRLATALPGALLFYFAIKNNHGATGQMTAWSWVLTASSIFLKLVLEVVKGSKDGPPHTILEASIFGAFLLSSIVLWLKASGVRVLNPFDRTTYSVAPGISQIIALSLHMLSVAFFFGSVLAMIFFAPEKAGVFVFLVVTWPRRPVADSQTMIQLVSNWVYEWHTPAQSTDLPLHESHVPRVSSDNDREEA
ncbi:uncharacterized protein FOMMEDRAFT_151897 [Fomitiporia mediterranea MF3/22]|uniref:uncharacterized protein n=1 Tax=Fomitiporia mediterranea (strain MF3/22) TaxID=694068 RepID=UPI000440830A|nr:uncharacterized protein FOMMEDRAFT_151897 [Fomitiporia mediterranea MF3/22]EJD06616.1 hypothetical protein FOMMEDRAFT_151897 [Fomitiporia mediterranea MF3/22]